LAVNTPDDRFEQEANRVADHVTRHGASGNVTHPTNLSPVPTVPSTCGRPLDESTPRFMEPQFDRDLTNVRVHTNPEAAESAHRVGARAYTVRGDIFFAANEYAPRS
jgi:hypothetical protein